MSPGAEKATVTAIARPPIASMSATLTAIALRPTSLPDDQDGRKWTFSTRMSVETITGDSSRSAAASSPGPISTSGASTTSSVIRSIRPNSPSSAIVASPIGFLPPCPEPAGLP